MAKVLIVGAGAAGLMAAGAAVRQGHQVYIICPMVEESDNMEAENVTDYAKRLREELPEDIVIGVLHGQMKAEQKNKIMDQFVKNEIQVLVSTTVVEVGVNVPNATVMMIENAERFGLAQLHQLRGRVGRGSRKSYCILVSESASGDGAAHDRLEILHTVYDGYTIAERDLAMRGPGDFLRGQGESTVRQSGGVKFRLAGLCEDSGLLAAAVGEAKGLLEKSPDLAGYPGLQKSVRELFTLEQGTVS